MLFSLNFISAAFIYQPEQGMCQPAIFS